MSYFMRFLTSSHPGVRFDKDGGGGGGGEGDDPPKNDPSPTEPGGRLSTERLKAKYGDAEAALRSLAYKLDEVEADNAKYLQEIRDLKTERDEGVLLTGEDARTYAELTKDASLKDVQGTLNAAQEGQQELARLQRKERMQTVAEAAGVNLDALEMAKGSDELEYVIEGEEDERKVFVKTQDENGTAVKTELAQYAEEHWKPLKASIFAAGEEGGQGSPRAPFPNQQPSGKPPKQGVSDEEIKKQQRKRHRFKI